MKLGECVNISYKKNAYPAEHSWLLNLDKIEQQTGKIISYDFVTSSELNGSVFPFDQNVVLYSKLRPNLNKVVLPPHDGYATTELLPLKPQTDILQREYLAFILRSKRFLSYAVSKTAGAKMPRLGTKTLLDYDIQLPSLETQKIVVEELNSIRNCLSLRRQQLDKLQQLAKSQFVEMFGECQNMKPLSDCGEIYTGATPSMSHPEYYDSDDICFLKPSDLSFDVKKITSSEYHVSNKASSVIRFFPPGAVLVTCIGATIGKLGISMIQGTCNQQINFIIPKVNCSAEYIAYALMIRKEDLMDAANSTAVPILNKTQFSNFRIPIPDTQEQTQFAAFVEHLDKSKFAIESSIEKLELLYRSKLQEYFG